MARLLHALAVKLLFGLAKLLAFFNYRLRVLIKSRENLAGELKLFSSKNQQVIWIHCASLGEFEQGRPVIEQLRLAFPNHLLLLTFFSPSGFEIRKNFSGVDKVTYLPFDTPGQVQSFIDCLRISFVILVKYEFWPILIEKLHQQHIPIISISSIFRSNQIFFRSYGSFYLNTLRKINYFFVQNQESKKILNANGLHQVAVSGDTRFDRVKHVIDAQKSFSEIEKFLDHAPCWVIGSAWAEDLIALNPLFLKYRHSHKFILAPHHVDKNSIAIFQQKISIPTLLYSDIQHADPGFSLIIIDKIGMLAGLYRYADFAWVGGAFGKGLHNILEAAAYGVPVFFGDRNFQKFQEALDLIELKAAFACPDFEALEMVLSTFESNPDSLLAAKSSASNYIHQHTGATRVIMDYLKSEFRA